VICDRSAVDFSRHLRYSGPVTRKQYERTRNRLLVGFAAAGFAALAGMWSFHFGSWAEDKNTAGKPPRGSDHSLEFAAEQRQIATDACKERDWDRCERALDRAAVLDPAGDLTADVKELRVRIAVGRRTPGAMGATDGSLPR
jgi:hypothetical protein